MILKSQGHPPSCVLLTCGSIHRALTGQRFGSFFSEDLDNLFFCTTTELENKKRVLVETLCQNIVDGGYVLAGVGPVGAGAVGFQIMDTGREEGEFDGTECLFYIGWHFTSKQ